MGEMYFLKNRAKDKKFNMLQNSNFSAEENVGNTFLPLKEKQTYSQTPFSMQFSSITIPSPACRLINKNQKFKCINM